MVKQRRHKHYAMPLKRSEALAANDGIQLWPPSVQLLAAHGGRFARVDAHDPADPIGSDRLWLQYTPDDAQCEGEVLSIAPAARGQDLWLACLESAQRFGGWSMSWRMAGTADELAAELWRGFVVIDGVGLPL